MSRMSAHSYPRDR